MGLRQDYTDFGLTNGLGASTEGVLSKKMDREVVSSRSVIVIGPSAEPSIVRIEEE